MAVTAGIESGASAAGAVGPVPARTPSAGVPRGTGADIAGPSTADIRRPTENPALQSGAASGAQNRRNTALRSLASDAVLLAQQLETAQQQYFRVSAARQRDDTQFSRGIRKALIVVAIASLLVAGVADILSLIDLGWVVSWLIPIIGAAYVRRINAINKTSEVIAKAAVGQHRLLLAARSRVRPLAEVAGRKDLLTATVPISVSYQYRSYVGRYVRDTLVTQVLELIPIVDWLPMYLGGVVKALTDQHRAYKKAKAQLQEYRSLVGKIDILERFEIDFYTVSLAALLSPALAEPGSRRSLSPGQVPAGELATA